jgi:hypothetical protein
LLFGWDFYEHAGAILPDDFVQEARHRTPAPLLEAVETPDVLSVSWGVYNCRMGVLL